MHVWDLISNRTRGTLLVTARKPKGVDSAAMIAIGCVMARNSNFGTLLVITAFNPVKPIFWTLTYETFW